MFLGWQRNEFILGWAFKSESSCQRWLEKRTTWEISAEFHLEAREFSCVIMQLFWEEKHKKSLNRCFRNFVCLSWEEKHKRFSFWESQICSKKKLIQREEFRGVFGMLNVSQCTLFDTLYSENLKSLPFVGCLRAFKGMVPSLIRLLEIEFKCNWWCSCCYWCS